MDFIFDLLHCGCGAGQSRASIVHRHPVDKATEDKKKQAHSQTIQTRGNSKGTPIGCGAMNDAEFRASVLKASLDFQRIESDYTPVHLAVHHPQSPTAKQRNESPQVTSPTSQRRRSLFLEQNNRSARRRSMTDMGSSLFQTFVSRSHTPEAVTPAGSQPNASVKRRGSFLGSLSFSGRRNSNVSNESNELPGQETNKAVYYGTKVTALFDYVGESSAPFPPDTRMELTVAKGTRLDVLETRPDGWCLVRKPRGTKEYWMPGNHLTEDGTRAYCKQ